MALEHPVPASPRPQIVRVAQYLRMSTEHQHYSIEFQSAVIAGYAQARGYELVRSYVDEGVSGLGIKRREGLRRLLADVVSGACGFERILVYDVSRWGRFQDPDQSAHYEFICKEAGVAIEYCAEPFVNDGTLAGSLVKHLKRAMAAEYSRELSRRVSKAQRALGAKGYWQGGPPPYGLRRLLLNLDGSPRMVLERGEHKMLHAGRTILVPGPPEEVETVRRIFRLFVVGGMAAREVARTLNAEGRRNGNGGPWSIYRVRMALREELYAGVHVVGKSSLDLGHRRLAPRSQWIRIPGAFEAIVPPWLFDAAGRNLRRVRQRVPDQILLDDLRRLYAAKGRLSREVVQQDPVCACPEIYARRFGGLNRAFELVGYRPDRRQRWASDQGRRRRRSAARERAPPTDDELIAELRALLAKHGRLTVDIIDLEPGLQAAIYRTRFGGMRRAYALAGYRPSARQEACMDAQGGQIVSRDEARSIGQAPEPSAEPPAD